MSAKSDNQTNRIDIVVWLVIVAIVLGGIYANMVYATVPLIYRALAGVGIAIVATALAMQTDYGKAAWNLAKEARVEVRKVVWPSREETTQTTLIVVLVVTLVGLLMWGLDSGLSWGVHALIG